MNESPSDADPALAQAYAHCLRIARAHYENFPVASMLVPARLRPHIAAVYAFARVADDYADEGKRSAPDRLAALAAWGAALDACVKQETESVQQRESAQQGEAAQQREFAQQRESARQGESVQQGESATAPAAVDPSHPIFLALGDTIRRHSIPIELFHDLLDAFRQDVTVNGYATFDDVLEYCRRSANPVGRILLALFGLLNERTAAAGDALCTALQLANFWQDVSVDARIPRVYIPEEDMFAGGVRREDLLAGTSTPAFRAVMAFEVERTRRYFRQAEPLFMMLPLRLRLELKAIHHGGLAILDAIERMDYDTVAHRPALRGIDRLLILLRALAPGPASE